MLILAAMLVPWHVAAGAGEMVIIPVHAEHTPAFASDWEDAQEHLRARLREVNEILAAVRIRLDLASVSEVASASLCEQEGSLFSSAHERGVAPSEIRLVVAAEHGGQGVLGCANQDSYGSRYAVAVVQDPPYDSAPLGVGELREHHANVLYAHEIGHVLGGLHGLAAPQSTVKGVTGTIMYPTLQLNIARYSGYWDGSCVQPGNACRIYGFVHGSAEHGGPHMTVDYANSSASLFEQR